MNKRILIIGSAAVIIIIGAGVFFFFNNRKNDAGPADGEKAAAVAQAPFVLTDATEQIIQAKKGTSELANLVCAAKLFNHASEKFVFPGQQGDIDFQQRVVDCAQQNKVDNYEGLMSGVAVPGPDLPARLKALACIMSPDYKRQIWAANQGEFEIFFSHCLVSEQHSPAQELVAGNSPLLQKAVDFCSQQIATYLPQIIKSDICSLEDDNLETKSFACLYTNNPDLEQLQPLPAESSGFVKQGYTELETAAKNTTLSACLSYDLIAHFNTQQAVPEEATTDSSESFSQPASGGATPEIRDQNRLADARQLISALELYYNDANRYPDSVNFGKSFSFKQTTYMAVMPTDPINDATYYYTYQKNTSGYLIRINLEAGGHLEVTPDGIKTIK